MAAINFIAWSPGVWADDVWALGVWEGDFVSDAAPTIGGGGSQAGVDKHRDPLVDQVLDKWAYIEEARKRDEPPAALIDEGKTAAPADVTEASFGDIPQAYAGPPVRLDFPGSMLAKPLPKGPKPLLPSAEQMVRDAIERDDEEALILILSQL